MHIRIQGLLKYWRVEMSGLNDEDSTVHLASHVQSKFRQRASRRSKAKSNLENRLTARMAPPGKIRQ